MVDEGAASRQFDLARWICCSVERAASAAARSPASSAALARSSSARARFGARSSARVSSACASAGRPSVSRGLAQQLTCRLHRERRAVGVRGHVLGLARETGGADGHHGGSRGLSSTDRDGIAVTALQLEGLTAFAEGRRARSCSTSPAATSGRPTCTAA